jgi:hypothetical protein
MMRISDNDLFRLQDGEPPEYINPNWDCETVEVSMASELLDLRADIAQRWISVEDRLPNNDDYVLVYINYRTLIYYENDFGINIGYYDENGWRIGRDYVKVLFWMPLPEPPEESEE